jgi:OOP family OmpA-OmpF porin
VAVDATGCPVIAEIADRMALEGVEFKLNSAELTASSTTTLDKVVEALQAYPNDTIEVAGYTDSSGNDEYNRELSQRRAESVRQYLIMKGIAPSRITAVGYGEENPIADNATREGRARNRRVEIVRTNP